MFIPVYTVLDFVIPLETLAVIIDTVYIDGPILFLLKYQKKIYLLNTRPVTSFI